MNFQANAEILRRLLPPQDDSLRVFPPPARGRARPAPVVCPWCAKRAAQAQPLRDMFGFAALLYQCNASLLMAHLILDPNFVETTIMRTVILSPFLGRRTSAFRFAQAPGKYRGPSPKVRSQDDRLGVCFPASSFCRAWAAARRSRLGMKALKFFPATSFARQMPT